jgi:Flp pilus assembly protein TadD
MSDRAASVFKGLHLPRQRGALLIAITSSLMLGACAQGGGMASLGESASLSQTETGTTRTGKPDMPKSELAKATEYWAKQSRDNPRDLDAALNYARNLKAGGQKGGALQVLQHAAIYHGQDRKLASEYGRLALELDQTNVAAQVLSVADDPAAPDWRVISARGTVLAKQGKYSEAVPFYERALSLSNNEPSVLNNLALAHTMSGEPQKAEQLLRQASSTDGPHAGRIRQNLALVLGVQGRHEEARQLGGSEDNTAVMQQMVKAAPQRMPAGGSATASITRGAEPGTAVGGWSTRVIPAKPAR